MKRILFYCLFLLANDHLANAQWWKDAENAEKIRSKGLLLLTSEIQNDASEAINLPKPKKSFVTSN
jgi:hypothetical protein